jgi:hypothetical protein
MALCQREGRFKALVTDVIVKECGPNNLCAAEFFFDIAEERFESPEGQAPIWKDASAEKLSITHTFWLEKKDGCLNDINIAMLRKATPWDGLEPGSLEHLAGNTVVQIDVVQDDKYKAGRWIVRWVYHENDTGRAPHKRASVEEKQALTNRLGSKFRALAMAQGLPVTPPAPVPKGDPLRFNALRSRYLAADADTDPEERELEWRRLVKRVGGRYTAELTEEELNELEAEMQIPF